MGKILGRPATWGWSFYYSNYTGTIVLHFHTEGYRESRRRLEQAQIQQRESFIDLVRVV